jgi:hypothetical protein
MVDHITDQFDLTVGVIQHAAGQILNVSFPSQVEANTPFSISYDCKNNGATDNMFGQILDIDTSTVIPGSRWDQSVAGGASIDIASPVSGITVPLHAKIQVGYTTA